jgi:hypothetical protein
MTIDMTSTLAPFGVAAVVFVMAGLVAVVTAALRARSTVDAEHTIVDPEDVRDAA